MNETATRRSELLYKLRCNREDLARLAMVKAQGRQAQLNLRLQQLEQSLAGYNEWIQSRIVKGTADPRVLSAYRKVVEEIRQAVIVHNAEFEQAKEFANRRRAELAAAIQRRQVAKMLFDQDKAVEERKIRRYDNQPG